MKKIITVLATAFCLNINAQYTDLYDFGVAPDGNVPGGNLISVGTYLYGMTGSGGANTFYGTIFKIMPMVRGIPNYMISVAAVMDKVLLVLLFLMELISTE